MTKKLFTFLTLFVMGLLLTATAARADLTLTPIRIVFQSRDHSASIALLNTSDQTNTYRLSWVIMKPTADGKYEMVAATKESDSDPHSVANMVIFSPRQVVIEPHSQQLIRLQLRRPEDLPPGEYRAHLALKRLAHAAPPVKDPNVKTIEMALKVNLGFSVPVIVRQGEDKNLKISLSNPALKAAGNGTVLKIDINRDAGMFSSYGTLHVFWTSPKGDQIEVGTMTNVALYPELKTRNMVIPLLKKYSYTGGKIRVSYEGKLESEGTTWAEKTFPIGK